ncbi:hypothetical protein UFOVP814_3 [uncultured Caudovirales phage]|uniref:Uncharacterized protein n=1 Tax=uncultured Caudovirales phage TaxID=2100421 RepID=A0A6J5NVW3_9CAUD|nr:hypothetical protein UFOVP814_3 [uncultured Caudovirales phage]
MDIYEWFLVGCVAFLICAVAGMASVNSRAKEQAAVFEKACADIGGKTVYNGRNYECLKGAKQ